MSRPVDPNNALNAAIAFHVHFVNTTIPHRCDDGELIQRKVGPHEAEAAAACFDYLTRVFEGECRGKETDVQKLFAERSSKGPYGKTNRSEGREG